MSQVSGAICRSDLKMGHMMLRSEASHFLGLLRNGGDTGVSLGRIYEHLVGTLGLEWRSVRGLISQMIDYGHVEEIQVSVDSVTYLHYRIIAGMLEELTASVRANEYD